MATCYRTMSSDKQANAWQLMPVSWIAAVHVYTQDHTIIESLVTTTKVMWPYWATAIGMLLKLLEFHCHEFLHGSSVLIFLLQTWHCADH